MSDSNQCPSKSGSFSWNELVTTDTAAATEFYGKLFDWHTAPFEAEGADGDYTLFKLRKDDTAVAGMVKPINADAPTRWVPYVIVEDAEAALGKASELGSVVLLPVTPVPSVGRIAIIKDPFGATLGLHELPKS